MKVAKIRLNSPAEEPEPTKKEEMIAHVNTVVELIKSYSNFNDWQAQSIVFWCIATYGHAELRKFPILVIMGAYRTGKTTALEMVQALANPPFLDEKASEELRRNEMIQVGSITPSVTDKLLSRGGTHCLDEAERPTTFYSKVWGWIRSVCWMGGGGRPFNQRQPTLICVYEIAP